MCSHPPQPDLQQPPAAGRSARAEDSSRVRDLGTVSKLRELGATSSIPGVMQLVQVGSRAVWLRPFIQDMLACCMRGPPEQADRAELCTAVWTSAMER